MTGVDPIRAAVWAAIIVFNIAIWGLAAWGAWDIGARVIAPMLHGVGSLNSCIGLLPGECVALAQAGAGL